MNHSATEKSHQFLHASGSNQKSSFVNKIKNSEEKKFLVNAKRTSVNALKQHKFQYDRLYH